MAEVAITGLVKRFDGFAAVNDLSLTVEEGKLMALVGPSGCGKSTTLRLLAGFLKPDGGEIRVDGQLLSSPTKVVPPDRRNMSMIFQSYAVWPHKTVFENIAFGLAIRKRPNHEIAARVRQMADFTKMTPLLDRYPGELSGGQQQRVALARALVVRPTILLLDEPLSNLDASLREELRYEIRRYHLELGITTVYVTHDQSEAMVTADRIAVLSHGRLEQIGTPEDIYERPASLFVADFVGRSSALRGRVVTNGQVEVCGIKMHVNAAQSGELRVGQEVAISIPPHAVRLDQYEGRERGDEENTLAATVTSQFYVGSAREYELSIAGNSVSLRALAPPWQKLKQGDRVKISVSRQYCWVIPT